MAITINSANLISAVNNTISALNLSTDSSERIALFYKVADNIEVSNTSLVNELISRLENVTSTAELEELLILIVATSQKVNDRTITASDLTTLESSANIAPGSIYFVEGDNLPYIKKINGTWTLIDPSLQPSLALENAYAWGNNTSGRLGDGTTTIQLSPVSVVGGFVDWIDASAGRAHSLGIRANGTLWAWGSNANGRLGDGTITDQSSPVSVVGGFTDWVSASAGGFHSLGVRANGTLWAWGLNTNGRLGDGTTTNKSSPVSVVGGFVDWVSASAGYQHSLGIRANGTVWAWGNNGQGQLGDGTTTSQISPVSVVGGFTDWIGASAGRLHSLGLRADGTAWAWGNNEGGQLGDGTTTTKSSPVSVVGAFTDWTQLSAGGTHSLGLRANGTAWAWGRNARTVYQIATGQLGDGTNTNRNSPVSVVGGFTDWIDVKAGLYHSFGIRANGTAWAWGLNARTVYNLPSGHLGDGTSTNRSSPVSVVGGFTDWILLSGGDYHSLGIRGS